MLTDSDPRVILLAMEITWLGSFCFRIRSREATIVTDPCPKSSGYAIGKVSADIVTVSTDHPENSNLAAITGSPLVVWGPASTKAPRSSSPASPTGRQADDAKAFKNTAYVIETENLRICHLGRLSRVPTSDEVEEMSGVDLLLVPVGGDGALNADSGAGDHQPPGAEADPPHELRDAGGHSEARSRGQLPCARRALPPWSLWRACP